MVSALSCKGASIRKGKGDIVLIGKSRMSPFVISFDWQRLRTSRTSTLVNRKQLSLATGRSVPRRRQSRSRAKPDQQSFVDAAGGHQPLKAPSLHRQPERKEAKRRMERSLPRRSNERAKGDAAHCLLGEALMSCVPFCFSIERKLVNIQSSLRQNQKTIIRTSPSRSIHARAGRIGAD